MDIVDSLRRERMDVEARLQVVADPAPTAGQRVLVVDGNLMTAEAIVLALSQTGFSARFALPVTVEHVRDLIGWEPGLVLIDLDSVDPSTCLECIEILHDAGVPTAIVAGKEDALLVGQCVQMGAASVVDKGSTLNELLGVVVRLLAGETLLTDELRQRLTEPYQRETRAKRASLAPFEVLTEREKYVLSELMDGHCAEDIARTAYVSISTVRSQIKAILQKLGLNSQLAVAAMARQAGWTYTEATATEGLASRSA